MPYFGSKSKAALAKCHPLLQDIANEAIKEIDFMVLDATRGRAAQERAFAGGQSKVRFGQSAHNYVPAIAFDLFPAPEQHGSVHSPIQGHHADCRGKEDPAPVGDWNSDGNKTTSDAWDKPHYELNPWREWAKKSQLFEG